MIAIFEAMTTHLSLFELNKLVQKAIDQSLEPSYWVVAEIAELRVNQNGHCYLELVEKEDHKIIAKSRATIWSYTYRNLSLWFERMAGESLKSGLKILCNVTVQYHEIYGLSFNIKDIDANYTLGERERKRQEVINQLLEDGIFEMNKELKVHQVLSKIAIISSPAAAGYEDFMNQLINNSYGYTFETRLFKATMQGENAANSIINALETVYQTNDEFEAVFIIRGGGSALDLDCFDNYELNFTAAQFPIPIITGIGHERDNSILDLVAFKSLKTPTAVAEWVIGKSMDFESNLNAKMQQVINLSGKALQYHHQTLENLFIKLRGIVDRKLQQENFELQTTRSRVKTATSKFLEENKSSLNLLSQKIDFLNPITTLKRGYTLTSINGKLITTENIKEGDIIETRTLSSIVKSIVKEKASIDEKGKEL